LGYAYFKRREKDDYTNANISFRKFLLSTNKYDENKTADATIRAADGYFMNRDFAQASELYKKAIALNKLDVDYSLYQKALCDGLNKNYDEKISELKKIESRYPASNYLVASLSEIADTYYNNLKNQGEAITYYEKILKNYPSSSFASNAYAQLGNIYYERKDDDKAFYYYDLFVKRDSKSDAAKDVLDAIRKIFEAKGNVDEMEKYFTSVGRPLTENQVEKATYTAAYDAFYEQKNCDLAMPKWEAYFTKFPHGRYVTESHFNYAECAYSKNMFDKAMEGYLYVINNPRTMYSETSLNKASYLLYKDKKYAEALPLFQQLQDVAETPANKTAGKLGAMRCAFNLSQFEVALEESNKVLATDKLTPQQTSEARYVKAKSLYETKRFDDALTEFKAITKSAKNVTGAEAFYHIGKIQFAKQDYKAVLKTINDLISYSYSNDDWNNRGMLLLADAYLAQGDVSDAKVILGTIIDAGPKQEYLEEAQKKLKEINELEAQKTKAPAESLNLQFKESDNDSSLFNKNDQPEN
jgi:TolA-binding protein